MTEKRKILAAENKTCRRYERAEETALYRTDLDS